MIQQSWSKRKHGLEHDYALIGWVLSLLPEIHEDIAERLGSETRMVIERFVAKLPVPPNPNPQMSEESLEIKLDIFWKDSDHFQNKTGPYG